MHAGWPFVLSFEFTNYACAVCSLSPRRVLSISPRRFLILVRADTCLLLVRSLTLYLG